MENVAKRVKDVFKDYETKGNILECEIINVSVFKKSSKIVIELKSTKKIQIGEKLAFEFYLKSKFRVEKAEIKIDVHEEVKQKKTKSEDEKEELQEEYTPVIIGGKRAQIKEKVIKVKDITRDSGKVVICGQVIKQELRELKSGKYLLMFNI